MAKPALTLPPGELMYIEMGFSGFSASRYSNCAMTVADIVSSTSPFKVMMRSCKRREKMSEVL